MKVNIEGAAFVHAAAVREKDPKISKLLDDLQNGVDIDVAKESYYNAAMAEAASYAAEMENRRAKYEKAHSDSTRELLRHQQARARYESLTDDELMQESAHYVTSNDYSVLNRPSDEVDILGAELKRRGFADQQRDVKFKAHSIGYDMPHLLDAEGREIARRFDSLSNTPYGAFRPDFGPDKKVEFSIESLIEE